MKRACLSSFFAALLGGCSGGTGNPDAIDPLDLLAIDSGAPSDAPAADLPPPAEAIVGSSGGKAVSSDGKLVLEVPEGAILQTTKLTVIVVRDVPRGAVSVGYDIGPTGLPFEKPAKLRLSYDAGRLQGLNASQLRVGTLVDGKWQEVLGSSVDTVEREVSAMLAHLSIYGIIPAGLPQCGDGVATGGEDCDGEDLAGSSCGKLGFASGGTLACTADCAFDTTGCYGCGDGAVNGSEQCEGSDLGGKSCTSLGFAGGKLACTAKCTLDKSGCYWCGDGKVNSGEQCDGNALGGATCNMLGFDAGQLYCSEDCTFNTFRCQTCGDGIASGLEQCDGTDLAGADCASRGFDGGTLACTADCRLDMTGCYVCGDGKINGSEQCDGSDLDGQTCASVALGYDNGQLLCRADCTLDTSKCATCGDGVKGGSEQCDGSDHGGATCNTLGYDGGNLSCTSSCKLDKSGCFLLPRCGDGTLNGSEQCEGSDLGGQSCASLGLGFEGGTLACKTNCSFDLSGCSCAAGLGDCDGDRANGCESDLSTLTDCGACDVPCTAPPNGSASCVGGVCDVVCDHGYFLPGCASVCGDGLKASDEACDDGNTNPANGVDDFCAADCQTHSWPCGAWPEEIHLPYTSCRFSMHTVSINGSITGYTVVAAGSTFPTSSFLRYDDCGYCPTCVVQGYVGLMPGAPPAQAEPLIAGCDSFAGYCRNPLFNHTDNPMSFTFTAPSTPGTYYYRFTYSLQYTCTGGPCPGSAQNVFAICVLGA